jgi:hypothetical protein
VIRAWKRALGRQSLRSQIWDLFRVAEPPPQRGMPDRESAPLGKAPV